MRVLSSLWPWLVPLTACAVIACASPKVQLNEGPREYVGTDYEDVLKRWTRTAQLTKVDEMDNVFTATATYESWDFRWAYVVRYADDYRLTIDQRQVLLERALSQTREAHQFYLAVYAQHYEWNDLKAKEPAWIVRLIDDEGTETAPTEIKSVKKPGAIEFTYFPYTNPWRSSFRITFPRIGSHGRATISPSARWFGLRFAGAQGNDELIWEVGAEGARHVASAGAAAHPAPRSRL
ncbi:MAG TPA: hypothetical protein VI197_18030 [Polyangiaceae bacterium]